MGVTTPNQVKVVIENVEPVITAHSVPLLPSNPEAGTRVCRRYNELYIDQEDALTFTEGETVTFLRWGNMDIQKIIKAEDGSVQSITVRFDAASTNFSKTKKCTWLAAVPDCVPAISVKFDHLISKKILGKFRRRMTMMTVDVVVVVADDDDAYTNLCLCFLFLSIHILLIF